MTVALARRPAAADAAVPTRDAVAEASFVALLRHIAANRFMPVPPGAQSVGDGDFRAIGAEFLGHFVRYGGLKPTDAVLDIGCGLGRMALPLTQYLQEPKGRYHGLEIVESAVDWCRQTISPVYRQFFFDHLDVHSDLYNPGGRIAAEAVALPVEAASFDFVVMTSLFTHMRANAAEAYLREVARTMRPGGRCFVSLFLMDDAARTALRARRGRLAFDPEAAGPEFHADPDRPLAAVAFDRAYFFEMAGRAGLVPAKPVVAGCWSGRGGDTYQDLCLLAHAPAPAQAPEAVS
jgi:SAM-dependent methyltransferase